MKPSAQIRLASALKRMLGLVSLSLLLIIVQATASSDWLQQESEHFTIIYRSAHAELVPHVLQSAESAFAKLAEIFKYQPAEKIMLMTADFSDYGSAGAMTVPQNFIRLDIAPFELGYENMPYHDRVQWLLNHELVHIFVNDQAGAVESFSRSLFSRVLPEQDQPLSICYSLLTNHTRYSPRWHQEGIAVFLETWLSGGFGRVLGNFDEMYFRTLALESKSLARATALETKAADESFMLGMLHYLYGTRFMAHLAAKFGAEKLMAWYHLQPGELYEGFEKKFKKVFGVSLHAAWQDFMRAEIEFQHTNIARLQAAPLTPISRLHDQPLGWVTQPYLEGNTIIFGYHHPHHLTAVSALEVKTHAMSDFGTLPTPSMIQVASTAFDPELQLLFFTTNNSKLFRDVNMHDLNTGVSRILFKDVRVGQLTVAAKTHELWGIRHSGGRAALVYSAHPYKRLLPVIEFEIGDELQHLAVSPSGRFLAATLHQSSGRQAIVVTDLDQLKESGRFLYQTISAEGSPEFPTWSPDEHDLYWNAYTNGVSNIYRARHARSRVLSHEISKPEKAPEGATTNSSIEVEALSHTLSGLFRPVYLSDDSLFAFEFSSEGFIPVVIPNRPATHLPAIAYFGQTVIDHNPELSEWIVQSTKPWNDSIAVDYSGLSELKIESLLPIISGFQDRIVFGLYTHIGDPVHVHDLIFETGVSNFNQGLQYHLKGRYEFQRKYRLEFERNAASFYDLFNRRKAGFIGTMLRLGHTRYLKFDEPHKIKQVTDLSLYRGLKTLHDNTVVLSQPDFAALETTLDSRNVRRAIGSVDSEFGEEWAVAMSIIGSDLKNPQAAASLHAEWGKFHTWLVPHNVLHLKIAGGLFYGNEDLALGKFYFGGFGNQALERNAVKQYREVFRFPGIPAYSLDSHRFAKLMIENNLPPLRLQSVGIGSHFLKHVDASLFTQFLMVDSHETGVFGNLGGQVNLVFNHWFNLESTVSAGVAQTWHQLGNSQEWFVSFKLLKN